MRAWCLRILMNSLLAVMFRIFGIGYQAQLSIVVIKHFMLDDHFTRNCCNASLIKNFLMLVI